MHITYTETEIWLANVILHWIGKIKFLNYDVFDCNFVFQRTIYFFLLSGVHMSDLSIHANGPHTQCENKRWLFGFIWRWWLEWGGQPKEVWEDEDIVKNKREMKRFTWNWANCSPLTPFSVVIWPLQTLTIWGLTIQTPPPSFRSMMRMKFWLCALLIQNFFLD